MDERLAGVYAKLKRADEHLDALYAQITAFVDDQPYGMFPDFDPHAGEHLLRVDVRRQTPIEWSVLVGDFLHNARSALDHLTWQLVRYGPKGLPDKEGTRRQVRFPIALTDGDFDGMVVLQYLGEEVVRALRDIQPYTRGDRAKARFHPLATLDGLWNTDKHRLLHTSTATTGDESPEITIDGPSELPGVWADYLVNAPVEQGTPIMKFRISPLVVGTYSAAWGVHIWHEPNVKVKGGFSVDVAFGDRRLRLKHLRELGSATGMTVGHFAAFLP